MALEDRKTRPIGAVMRLYQKQVDDTLARKRLALQEAQISKQLELDPNYRTFDSNRHVVMDSDTFRDRISGEIFRIGDGRLSDSGPGEAGSYGGYAIDSFETGEDQYGVKNNFYEKNPERFKAHRAALAAQLSLDEDDITEEDLYEVGRAQSANMKERAARGDFDGMGFTVDGLDHSGSRSMARFDSPEMADIVTNGVNAAYGSKYNWRDILERVGEADPSEIPEGTRNPIKWTKDGLVAATRTVGDVSIDTLTLASIALGFVGIKPLNDLAAALQRGKEQAWTPLMDALASDKAVYMREMEQKFQQVVTEPLYKARKAKYLYQGNNRATATVKAWLMGGADTLEYLKENPARLVDTAIESLPYMVGANITARIATKGLEKRMKATMARRKATDIRNGHMSATQQAIFHKAIAKKGMWASVGFTGVTEGLGNAAGVYARILNMTPKELADSEPYKKRIEEGMSHKEAVMDMANKGALSTFVVTGILAAAANKFSGAGQLEANLFRNIGKNVKPTKGAWAKTKEVIRPARQEGVEEFFQSGGGEIVGQHVAAAVTDKPELVSGGRSAAAAATGVAAGIVSGGAIGNVSNAGKAIKAGAKGTVNLFGRDKVDSASVRKVRVKLADLTRSGKAVSKDKDGKVKFDRLGGDINQTKTELGAIDKAAGGQTANNVLGLFKQKFSQIPKDTAALLPESTKLLVSEAEYLQREYERRYDENDEKQVAELRKMKAATKILKQNFKQALPLVLHEVLNDQTLEDKERKQLIGAITGEAQIYGLNPDKIMLHALKGLKLPKDQSDSMADVIRQAGEAAGFSAQLIDTLTDTVQKANSDYKDNPLAKTIKQVAFDLMYGGTYTVNGRKKKSIGIFHLGQQMMEASREGKIETFNKLSKQYEALVRYKARQVAATEKFIELVEGGMDQKQAREEALNHAGLNKTAMKLWMDESGGLLRLLQQRREEVYIMAKHMNKLHKQWGIDRKLYGEEQWTKKQKALLHWVQQQPFVKAGQGLANLGLKVPGYDQEFLDKFIAHSGELQTALQKIAQIEHTNKKKVRDEAKLAHRKKRYNHKEQYKRPARDENVDPDLGVNKLWWHQIGKLIHNTFRSGPKKGQANLAGTKQKPRNAPTDFNPLYELGKAVANRYILSEQENFKTVDEDGNEIKGTGRGDTWYFFEAADAVLRIYAGGVKSNAYKQFLRGYGDELRRRRGGDYEGIPSFEERTKLAPREGTSTTPAPKKKKGKSKPKKPKTVTPTVDENDQRTIEILQSFVAELPAKLASLIAIEVAPPDNSRKLAKYNHGVWLNRKKSGEKPIVLYARNIRQSPRWKDGKLDFGKLIQWVIFHELSHSTVKRLFGSAASKDIGTYRALLLDLLIPGRVKGKVDPYVEKMLGNTKFLRQNMQWAPNDEWVNAVIERIEKDGVAKTFRDMYEGIVKTGDEEGINNMQMVLTKLVEESLMELAGAMWAHDMVPRDAFKALDAEYGTDFITSKYVIPQQRTYQAMVDTLMQVLRQLFNAAFTLSRSWSEAGLAPFGHVKTTRPQSEQLVLQMMVAQKIEYFSGKPEGELGQESPAPQVNRPVNLVHEDDQDEGNPFSAVVDPATVSNWEPADESAPSTPTFDLNDPNRTVEVTLKNGETVVLNVEQAQQLLDRIEREAQQEAHRNDPNDFADDAMADSTEDPDMAALLQAFLGQKPKTVKQTPPKQESAQVPHDNPFDVGDVGNVQDWGDVYGETLDPDQLDNPPAIDNPFDVGGVPNVTEIPDTSGKTAQPQAQERPAWNTPTPPTPYTQEQLRGLRQTLKEIKAYLSDPKLDRVPASQIHFSESKPYYKWNSLVESARDKNKTIPVRETLEEWEKAIEDGLKDRNQSFKDIEELENINSEEAQVLGKDAATILEGGTIETNSSNVLSRMINFAQRHLAPYLYKVVDHTTSNRNTNLPLSRQWRRGNRWTLEQVNDPENETQFLHDLRVAFRKQGLPTALSEMFRVAKDQSSNLLHHSLGVFQELHLKENAAAFLNKLGRLSARERSGFMDVVAFVNKFDTKFREMRLGMLDSAEDFWGGEGRLNRTPFKAEHHLVKRGGGAIWNPLQRYALQFFMEENGSMDPNIIAIMALEVGDWMATNLAGAMVNDEDVIREIFHLEEDEHIPDHLKLMGRQGTLESEAARAIGARIMQRINYNVSSRGVTPLMRSRMEMSFGAMAISVVKEMQLVESRAIPHSFVQAGSEATMRLILPLSSAFVPFIGYGEKGEDGFHESYYLDKDAFKEDPTFRKIRVAFNNSRPLREKLFGNASYTKEPTFEPVKEPPRYRARTKTKIPFFQRAVMKLMNAKRWKATEAGQSVMNLLSEDMSLNNKLLGGFTDEEIEGTIGVIRSNRAAKAAGINRALQNARDWQETLKAAGKTFFHFSYKMISTGRFYIESNLINPQADKIHRFLYGMPEWDLLIDPTSEDTTNVKAMKIAIALGLDLKITHSLDRATDVSASDLQEMVEYLDNLMQNDDTYVRAKLIIKEALDQGRQLTVAETQELIDLGVMKEGMHSLIALHEYVRYEEAVRTGKSFTAQIALEVDGKTNGIAIGSLQTPDVDQQGKITDLYYTVLAGTGIFGGQYSQESFKDYRENPENLDNYEGTASDTGKDMEYKVANGWFRNDRERANEHREWVQQRIRARKHLMKAILAIGFLKLNRNLAKDPLMVSSYNAGILSVQRNLAKIALNNYYEELSDLSHITDLNELAEAMADISFRMAQILYAGSTTILTDSEGHTMIDDDGKPKRYRGFNKDLLDKDGNFNPEFTKPWGTLAQYKTFYAGFKSVEELHEWRRSTNLLDPAAPIKRDEEGERVVSDDTPDFRGTIEDFNAVIIETYGKSMAKGIAGRITTSMRTKRGYINDGIRFMNAVSATLYNALVARSEADLKRSLAPQERERIMSFMRRKGWIASVRPPYASELDEYIEIFQTENVALTTGANIDVANPERGEARFYKERVIATNQFNAKGKPLGPKVQKGIGYGIFGLKMTWEVGVRGFVNLIHASDGSVMARILKGKKGEKGAPVLGVHDAIIGNPVDILKRSVEANEAFHEVQGNWDLGFEVAKRMKDFIRLLNDDQYFTDEQRDEIYKAIAGKEKIEKDDGTDPTEQEKFQQWLGKFTFQLQQNSRVRKEVFSKLKSINQFAIDKASFLLSKQTFQTILDSLSTARQGISLSVAEESHRLSKATQEALETIYANIEQGGDPGTAFIDALRGNHEQGTDFVQAVDIFWEVVTRHGNLSEEHTKKLRFLVGAIKSRSYRKWDKAKLTVRVSDNEGDQVTYYPKSHVIRIPAGMNISEVGQRLIQGGIEAALHDQFRELERDPVGNDAILLDVYQRAIKWMLTNFEAAKAGKLDEFMTAAVFKAEAIKSAHDKVQGKDQDAINERAAIKRELAVHYLTTTQGYMTQDESGQVGFQVDEATLKVATEVFARALEGGTFRPIYHSSPRGVNTRRFNEEDSQKLTRQLAESILSQFFQEETLSTEEQQFLAEAGKPLLEALEHVDTILLNMVGGNPSGLNEGAFIETDNTILLETSDGTIGTPTEMSKQEALLHEMYHGILKVALKHSGFMRRVRKTFDIVDKKVQDGTITWKDMLADPANYTAIEEQIARERFDHIFKYRRGADGAPIDADIIRAYAEFLTIASTNYKFNRKLAEIQMKEEPYTFWKGTLFDTIMGLVQDLFNWLAGAATGQNKDARHAVQRLSKDMIKIARRHRKVQLKRPDGGPVQTGLDWADRKILEKIASLNTANLQQWALRNSLPYQDFQRELENKDSELSRLIFAAKSMLASAASPDMDWSYFRDAMDSAMWGYKKDGTVYQLLQEILPWAKRNHAHIDILRKSQYLIDTLRQKTNEITRGSLIDMWGLKQDPMKTNVSEAVSMVMLRTDLAALMGRFGLPQIAEFIMDPVKVAEAVGVLEQELERALNSPRLMQHFQWQMDGLAWLMIKGTPKKGHFWTEYNAHNIVHQQGYLPVTARGTLENSTTLVDLVDHIVSLKALLLVDDTQLRLARTRITSELAKGEFNGFFGTLPMVSEYKAKALEKSFKGNPIHMWKGYIYEQFDEDKDAQWVKDTPRNRQVMEQAGYKLIATYPPAKYLKEIDAMLENPQSDILLYVHSARGVNTYSKAAFSTTREQKRGFGIFDINFTLDIWEEFDPNVSAARTKSVIQSTAEYARMLNQQAMEGRGADLNQQIAVPLYDESGKVTDLRFLMTEKHKRQYLGKRERLEEIFPRMLASIEDRTNSKLINHEIIDLLFGEYLQFGNDPDHRFVIIGDDGRFSGKTALEIRQIIDELKAQRKIARQSYDREAARQLTDRIKAAQKSLASKEMWDLFPKDTQIYARELFGGDFVYVRDEVHNMIFGFRKLSLANSGLFGRGKIYTAAHIAEKIWQEIIQWERFRIAVLKPQVVLGNIVSNIFVLLAHNVPPQYIYRKSIEAISNMRNYQVSVNELGQLQNKILADKALNKNTSLMERKAARLDYAIRQNPANELVEEGLFTSIVEEIAPDEQSSRKQAMQWLMDKGGKVLTGQASRSVGNVANELWMLPGSQTARLALMGTQYGDFVARYVQYSWDTQVKGKDKEDAMRDALSTFIYYNIPQNKYLQWMNDNGFFMFTKFFFRIQHITLRLLRHSPTRALGAFLFQSQHEYSILGDTVGEYTGNIHRLYRKLDPNPVDNIIGGGTFTPNLFEWFQFAF